ncbi:MAG: hypothetical protein AAF203_09745 [Pseudomonadota bacterium]
MKMIFRPVILMVLIFLCGGLAQAQEAKDCSCPRVSCGPCQKKVTVGKIVKFCDWGDINVCRKTVCENVSFYFKCLTDYNKNRTQKNTAKKGDIELLYEQAPGTKEAQKRRRSLASPSKKTMKKGHELISEGRIEVGNDSRVIQTKEYSNLTSGNVTKGNKKLQLFHRGQSSKLGQGRFLYVGDEIANKTKSSQSFQLLFDQGPVTLLMPGPFLTVALKSESP